MVAMLDLILSAQSGSKEQLLGLSEIFDSVDAFIFIKDLDGRYKYVNKKVLQGFDVKLTSVKGQTDWHLFNYGVAKMMRSNDKNVISTKKPSQQKIPFQINGRAVYHLTVTSPIVKNGEVHGVIGFAIDISKDMQERELLVEEANTDGLTGCYNRRFLHFALEEQAERYIAAGIPYSLLIIDVDRFKPINDKFGHSTGDKVLVEVVKVINKYTRDEDLLCRYGGDEFVLVLPGSSVSQAYMLGQRLSEQISKLSFECSSGEQFGITCSIGASTQSSLESNVIEKADKALYVSKKYCMGTVHMYCPELLSIRTCELCDDKIC